MCLFSYKETHRDCIYNVLYETEIKHLEQQIANCKDEKLKKELIKRKNLYPRIKLHNID